MGSGKRPTSEDSTASPVPSRRRLLAAASTLTLGAVPATTTATPTNWLHLSNDADRPRRLSVAALAADGEVGDGAPSESDVREKWTWTLWLSPGESRRPVVDLDDASTRFVRVHVGDDVASTTWAASGETVAVTATETGVRASVHGRE